jgi:hypothetical protein
MLFFLELKEDAARRLAGYTPSEGCKSTKFNEMQHTTKMQILNGRYCTDISGSTIGPPIQLFNAAFAHFLDDVSNQDLDVPPRVLQTTCKFMKAATALYQTESDRVKAVMPLFSRAISAGCMQLVNEDRTSPDSSIAISLGGKISDVAALLLAEFKRELAEAGDPVLQVQLSHGRWWSQPVVRI